MPAEGSKFPQIVYTLLEPLPQYVVGCFPALAIMGESPMDKFTKKLAWLFLCLGCPFIGLFYTINVGGEKESRCLYWLSSDHFTIGGKPVRYRPFGVHIKRRDEDNNQDHDIPAYVKRCTAEASVLERLSPLISTYYITMGIIAGISRTTTGSVICEEWPYIPLLLSWTIPAIIRRTKSGNLVVKDPNDEFINNKAKVQIAMTYKSQDRDHKLFTVTLTAFVSIVYPWITVLLAYFTPPVGYYCRSIYITIICSIWSFNNFLAYIFHLKGERKVTGLWHFHVWFSICGFIVALLLILLGFLTKYNEWWDLIGALLRISCRRPSCD